MHHPAISLPYWFQLNRVEHYWFEANGKRFAYAYIRKNACTAFKTLICETSRRADFVETGLRPMRFMNKYHRIKTRRQLDQCHTRLFVYRDPYGRLVSAYLNKFVARKGHEDIFQRYQSATGQHPDDTSFRDFVTRYCIPPFSQRDKHVRPQASRLLDLPYDHAIEMGGYCPKCRIYWGPNSRRGIFPDRGTERSIQICNPARWTCAQATWHSCFATRVKHRGQKPLKVKSSGNLLRRTTPATTP
ncbi:MULTISPECIES: sulfotransferase family 2 domain-containing protein [unclassified Aliiroseovarius]|nr:MULTISPECIES: sulfotransferase family 2 domain-containing protein [unclassified Aliiroseovarius]